MMANLQLARHNKELSVMLKPGGGASGDGDEALEFYAKHTAQIEVKHPQPKSHTLHRKHLVCGHLEYLSCDSLSLSVLDCASGSHHGGDSFPRTQHL